MRTDRFIQLWENLRKEEEEASTPKSDVVRRLPQEWKVVMVSKIEDTLTFTVQGEFPKNFPLVVREVIDG